jgi:hypothetical protein
MEAMRLLCEVQSAQLTKPGDLTSLRLLFPIAWDFDCYGDVSPMTQISGSENTRKLVFGRYDSIECGGELLCGLLRT